MGKSELLKNSMKGGLNELISSTAHPSQKREAAVPAKEKEVAVHCNFVMDKSLHIRMKILAIKKDLSLREVVNEAMKEYLEKNEK